MAETHSKNILRILLWTGAVLTAVLIFCFSSQASAESTNISDSVTAVIAKVFINGFENMTGSEKIEVIKSMNGYVRKAAHFSIYTLLSVFVISALLTYKSLRIRAAVQFSVLICAGYASTDELHQYFVPGRSCELRDVLIDTSGAVLGIFTVLFVRFLYKKVKSKGCL